MAETKTKTKTKTAKKQTIVDEYWAEVAETHLLGRTIVGCRYMSREEAEGMDWYSRPLVLELDDGALVFPSRDDEGNDGGALFGNRGDENLTFPVLNG